MGDSYKDTGSFTALPQNSPFPGATPKYAKQQARSDGYKDTMARLYLSLDKKSTEKLKAYFGNITGDDTLEGLVNKLTQGGLVTPPPPAAPAYRGYIEFLLQNATQRYNEKVDVVETLADKYAAYSYGSSHPVFSYQVAMLNNKQDDQAANMYRLYWHVLRATRLAGIRTEAYFEYDRMVVSGVMTSFSWSLTAADESYCQGSFDMLVRRVMLLPPLAPSDNSGGSKYDADAASLSEGPAVTASTRDQWVTAAGAHQSVLTIQVSQ